MTSTTSDINKQQGQSPFKKRNILFLTLKVAMYDEFDKSVRPLPQFWLDQVGTVWRLSEDAGTTLRTGFFSSSGQSNL